MAFHAARMAAREPQNYDPDNILAGNPQEIPLSERMRINENARRACLREWLKQTVRDEMRLAVYEADDSDDSDR